MTRVAEIISMNSSKMIKTNKQKTNNERKKINISVAIFLVLHDPRVRVDNEKDTNFKNHYFWYLIYIKIWERLSKH